MDLGALPAQPLALPCSPRLCAPGTCLGPGGGLRLVGGRGSSAGTCSAGNGGDGVGERRLRERPRLAERGVVAEADRLRTRNGPAVGWGWAGPGLDGLWPRLGSRRELEALAWRAVGSRLGGCMAEAGVVLPLREGKRGREWARGSRGCRESAA